MTRSVVVVWISVSICTSLANPYLAIIPSTVSNSEEIRNENAEENETRELFSGDPEIIRNDCLRILRIYSRSRMDTDASKLLIDNHIDDNVVDSCLKFLSSNSAASFNAIKLDDATVQKEEYNTPDNDAPVFQKRAFDYIRFGKRLIQKAKKRIQVTSKSSAKNTGMHDYIRFG